MKNLLYLLLVLLFLNSNLSALDDVDLEFEVGMMNAEFGGDITNSTSTTGSVTFDDDLGFTDSTSSYFAVRAKFGNEWIPTIYVNYMNFSESQTKDLFGQIGDSVFGSSSAGESVTSNIDYKVINTILYYEFKSKGKRKRMFGKQRYTGDFEIDLGINLKNVDYSFDIAGTTDTEFIKVKSSILLPYAAMRYYLYYLSVFADISTLSFSDVKATSYSLGIDYEMIRNLYLGLTYFYEDFEETISNDTIDFQSSGFMFSVKYAF